VADAHVRFEISDRVAVVTLDRPEHRNAFSGRMALELGAAYAACDADDDVRAVVLTGAGDVFCAGAELGPDGFGRPRRGDRFTASPVRPPAWDVRKPVIAAINGHAVGIGLTLPMQCDIRLVAEDARLGFLQARRGTIPDAQSHWTVTRAAGLAVAADLFMTGRIFSGRDAVALGLVSRALPAPEVLPAALEIGREIATNVAPLSAALTKRLLWDDRIGDPVAVEHLETEYHRVLMKHTDAGEGPRAWLEKRAPRWAGRPSEELD
jgi:enoyl-CoA hydratase/carnithine racemase